MKGRSVQMVCVLLPLGMCQYSVGSTYRLMLGSTLYCTPTLMPVDHCSGGVMCQSSAYIEVPSTTYLLSTFPYKGMFRLTPAVP